MRNNGGEMRGAPPELKGETSVAPIPQEWKDGVRAIENESVSQGRSERKIFAERRSLTFTKKTGETVAAEEIFEFTGNGFQFSIYVDGERAAFLRYQIFGNEMKMGKTWVDEECQQMGINTQLFQDMSDLHAEANTIWATLDEVNSDEYIVGLESGLDRFDAADNTPAGKVRRRAGWMIDRERSHLPEFTDGVGFHAVGDEFKEHNDGIKAVYTRETT